MPEIPEPHPRSLVWLCRPCRRVLEKRLQASLGFAVTIKSQPVAPRAASPCRMCAAEPGDPHDFVFVRWPG